MATPNSQQIEYDIILKASQALIDLRNLTSQASSFKEQIDAASKSITNFSAQTGMSIRGTTNLFKDLDKTFSNVKGGKTLALKNGWDEAGKAAEEFGKKSKSAFDQAISGVNAWRIALGAVISMLLFQGIQAIQRFFSEAIDQAKQFEATLYRISNAERQLSLDGVEVSVKGLKEGIEDLRKAFPIFSKEDIAELIGGIATTTKELGLSEEQMLKLGAAVAILNVNSTESETLLQTMGKVVNSVISPQAKSVGNLGLAFGKAKIEAKAFEMQILQTGETFEDLTEKEKTEIKFQIVLDTAGIGDIKDLKELRDSLKDAGQEGTELFAALNSYLESNAAKIDANTAAWKDLQTVVGSIILPFLPALTDFFTVLRDGLNAGKVAMIEFIIAGRTLQAVMQTIFQGGIGLISKEKLVEDIRELRETLVNEFFKEMPEDAPEWFDGWGNLIKGESETATEAVEDFGEEIKEIDTSALERVEEVFKDTANAIEDLNTDLWRKLEDLEEEYRRKSVDAETDYLRKVDDINRDYENDLAKLKRKHREEDEKDEAKYQLALWELRQRFLMNLEDALHARDARQVLRLQKQYAIDKEALRRKHELENREREQSQKEETQALEEQKQKRIEDARIEYEQKLADLNLAKQREAEDLAKWYAREIADIEEAQDRKLKALLDGWAKEQELTEANAAQIYAILLKYFGPGGLTDELYGYMMNSMLATTVAAAGSLNALLGLANGVNPFAGSVNVPAPEGSLNANQGLPMGSNPFTDQGFAEGGTLLATRPTRAVFGEGGPELVNFMPLDRIGKNINKVFGDKSGMGGGMNGQIRILVDLSPDLEGRIVEKSMDGVADVVAKVGRMK